MNYVKKYLHNRTYVWQEILGGVYYLCGLATFYVLRELIDGFFLMVAIKTVKVRGRVYFFMLQWLVVGSFFP